ncbi:hypothetical protein U9M48_038574 [Paspalum notatum var. saurae]|uniref:BRI1 kinase inhibitor 1 n=1 Tax=Paspalum notatum var. saurae TaxID=547442 RepID=A0AAQ3XDP9_PASNO
MSSHRLVGRVVSDLSHSTSRSSATDLHCSHHQQSTTTTSNSDGGNGSRKTKQKLALLISSVVAWTRSSEGSGETAGRTRAKNTRQQCSTNDVRGSGAGAGATARRRGLEIVLTVRKYVAMLERLLTSYSGGGSSSRRDDVRRRRRPHTFTFSRQQQQQQSSSSRRQRHRGRLSSAPASLRGSPANSGHLSVGETVTTKTSTSSEVSTMEELQSAIQAAIAHCKNSVAAAGDGRGGGRQQQQQQQQERKC